MPRHDSSVRVRHAVAFALAVGLIALAMNLARLHERTGPHRQRVNVRFAEGVSKEARLRLEQELGLLQGVEGATDTWVYDLARRSPADISRILENPLVRDTAHIDTVRLRVAIDQPQLAPWLRDLVEAEWLPTISWGLGAVGVALLVGVSNAILALLRRVGRLEGSPLHYLARQFGQPAQPIGHREIAVGLAMGLVFLLPLLVFGPVDDEEGALGFFSGQIYYRDMFRGYTSYWFHDLGFGTSLPLGQRLDFHPAFGLGSLVSLRAALSATWLVQTAVGVVCVQHLLAAAGLGRNLRFLLLGTYLFSVVQFFYFYATDWLSCVVPWTLYPAIVWCLRDVFLGGAATRPWLSAARLGLLLGLWVINGHPGYLVPLAVALGTYVAVAAPKDRRTFGVLGVATLLALCISAERIYFALSEMRLFPTLARSSQEGYSLWDYLDSLRAFGSRGLRSPLIGAPLAGATAIASYRAWCGVDRHLRGCAAAAVIALGMSTVPLEWVQWSGISALWLFRDPLVLFSVLLAGTSLQAGCRAQRPWVRAAVALLILGQIAQQATIAGKGYVDYYRDRNRLEFYRHQGRPFGVGRSMVDHASRYGGRLYFTEYAQRLSRGATSNAGIHLITDYALLGLSPVNGTFKNVSMDRIYPSAALMHGRIDGQLAVIHNGTLLDVLGINLVVAAASEQLAPAGLVRLGPQSGRRESLDIFANPDAWPRTVLMAADAAAVSFPVLPGCGHDRALCRHYDDFAAKRLPDHVTATRSRDGYRVAMQASARERLLFVSTLYRPEWRASASGRALQIHPVAGAFVGVTVPPGTEEIQLSYSPGIRRPLTWLSVTTVVSLLVFVSVLEWGVFRGRRRVSRRDRAPGQARESGAS